MQEASSKQQAKQNLQTKSSADRITTSSSFHHQRKNKQAKKKKRKRKKSSAQISPYMKLIQATVPTLGRQNPKGRKNSTLNPGKRISQTQ